MTFRLDGGKYVLTYLDNIIFQGIANICREIG
jgi:hypothetical protein